jgi:acetyl/propionyl-CoA carboxylase alpha subunit
VRLLCGDDRHDIALRPTPDGVEVTAHGRAFRLRVTERAPGVFVVEDGASRETFHCVRDGETIHLFWRGVVYVFNEERDGGRPAHRAAAGSLEAPMPGKVIAVRVAAGQAVRKGDELLVVEAMKMENALRAPRDGVVKAVAVKPGDMVSPGLVLVELS